jgi:hypothetical protein
MICYILIMRSKKQSTTTTKAQINWPKVKKPSNISFVTRAQCWNETTCASAAVGGHLKVLQWARTNSCPWDETTCSFAAGEGHLAVLQWARTNGCPWDNMTYRSAARHLEVLQWARANGAPE